MRLGVIRYTCPVRRRNYVKHGRYDPRSDGNVSKRKCDKWFWNSLFLKRIWKVITNDTYFYLLHRLWSSRVITNHPIFIKNHQLYCATLNPKRPSAKKLALGPSARFHSDPPPAPPKSIVDQPWASSINQRPRTQAHTHTRTGSR